MVLAIRISKQEKDFGKSISERTGMYMGITDVTAGGAVPIRVEMPQVLSPAPQRAPKQEVKTPSQTAVNHAPASVSAPSTADAVLRPQIQPEIQQAQSGNLIRAVKGDAGNGQTGERVSGQQRVNRAGRVPAQDVLQAQNIERVSGQQEERKAAGQDSYYEKVMAEKAMENAKERLRSLKYDVQFGYDDKIERYTIKIMDADNKEVRKEIPSEEIQKMIEHLHTMKGMMFETEI